MKKIQLFLLQFLLISITQHTNAQLPVKQNIPLRWEEHRVKEPTRRCGLLPTGKVYLLPIPKWLFTGRDCTYNAIKPTFRLQCRTGFGNRLQFHLLLHHPTSLCRPQLPMVEPEYRQQRTLARIKEFQVKQRRYGRIK